MQERKLVAQIDVRVEPEGMAVSHDGKWAITTSETTNMVHWIDVQKQELTHDISVIDVAELMVIKSIPVGRFLWGVAIRP